MNLQYLRFRRIAFTLLAITALGGLSYLLGWSSFFSVKSIVVTGAPANESVELIAQMSGIEKGSKLARIESRVVVRSLSRITWIDHSQVRRDWLREKIVITVWPRVPVARFNDILLDKNGVGFQLTRYNAQALPLVNSSKPDDLYFAMALLRELPNSMTSLLQSIETEGSHFATLKMKVGVRVLDVVWGDENDTELKVHVYQALLALPENRKISSMDLSAPHAPIVR
ncbi:MAG: FtsQ-type POTRA domain-containing protein [Streptomycetaceae bacterium]|nr:MAG: FtsQ-type POTRA domain-containing protein [Streptomycetaceae bacterium]